MSKKFYRSMVLTFAFFILLVLPGAVKAQGQGSYYATTQANIRLVSNGEATGSITSKGQYLLNGEKVGNYVHFTHAGKKVKVYSDYVIRTYQYNMYIKDDANVRNSNLTKVGIIRKGHTISAFKLGNYYRFLENGKIRFVHQAMVTDQKPVLNQPIVKNFKTYFLTSNLNVRNARTGKLVTSYPIGKVVKAYEYNGWIHFNHNGEDVKIYSKYAVSQSPTTKYVKYDAKVYNDKLQSISIKSKGSKIHAVKIGNYYRYYDNGTRLIHAGNISSSYVAARQDKLPTIASTSSSNSPKLYTLNQFRFKGVVNWGGYKYTFYSQRVLPGRGLKIPGRHVNADGYVADKDGYIVIANSSRPKGTVVPTPFGYMGKVYDRGVYGNHLDVYVR